MIPARARVLPVGFRGTGATPGKDRDFFPDTIPARARVLPVGFRRTGATPGKDRDFFSGMIPAGRGSYLAVAGNVFTHSVR